MKPKHPLVEKVSALDASRKALRKEAHECVIALVEAAGGSFDLRAAPHASTRLIMEIPYDEIGTRIIAESVERCPTGYCVQGSNYDFIDHVPMEPCDPIPLEDFPLDEMMEFASQMAMILDSGS